MEEENEFSLPEEEDKILEEFNWSRFLWGVAIGLAIVFLTIVLCIILLYVWWQSLQIIKDPCGACAELGYHCIKLKGG